MKAAVIGPIQSGKSSLLSAVSGKPAALSGALKIEERSVPVPDPRLQWLTQLYKPKKTVYAAIDCLDIPGLNLSEASGRSAAKRLIDQARTVDIFIVVVRAFDAQTVPPYRGSVDPARDISEILSELILTDLELVATRIENLKKQIKKGAKGRSQDEAELSLQIKLQEALEDEKPLRELKLGEEEADLIKSLNLFTIKPLTIVVNTDEHSLASGEDFKDRTGGSVPIITLSAKLEQELSQLDHQSRIEFMDELGLQESAAEKLVACCYTAMGLVSFLTVGPDEVRAWPIRRNSTALEAAGKIHSDIRRGFIRAETMGYEELHNLGSEKDMRAAGRMRLEGKEYIVQDGDIVNFRFNV